MPSKIIFTVTFFDTDPDNPMVPHVLPFSSRDRAVKFIDAAREIINSTDTTLRMIMDCMPLDDFGYLEYLRDELFPPPLLS